MGYLGVKTLVDHLRGRRVDAVVDTGVALVTPENLGTVEIKKILQLP
jgi:ribose transport system substrate-binding protein